MMRYVLLLVTSSVLLSCNKQMIQLAHIKPVGALSEERDGFVFDNDTVRVTYSFWAVHGKFEFTIENKLTTPIYIDWKKSNLVYNSAPNVYWADETSVSTRAITSGVGFRGSYGMAVGSAVTAEESVIRPKERVTFLPPSARITRNEYAIESAAYYFMNPVTSQSQTVPNEANPKKETTIYRQSFTDRESSVHLTNFLTLSDKESFEREWFIENKFYLSEVNEMELSHFRGKCKGVDEQDRPICPRLLKSEKKYYLMVPKGYDFERRKKMKLTRYEAPPTQFQ